MASSTPSTLTSACTQACAAPAAARRSPNTGRRASMESDRWPTRCRRSSPRSSGFGASNSLVSGRPLSLRTPFALHDARLVLARAYAFDSRSKLKAHVDGTNAEQFITPQHYEHVDIGSTNRMWTRSWRAGRRQQTNSQGVISCVEERWVCRGALPPPVQVIRLPIGGSNDVDVARCLPASGAGRQCEG